MTLMKLVAVFVSVSVCWACWPIPRDDKTDYCFSDLAFEATIENKGVNESVSVYAINVGKVYKGDAGNIPSVLQGFGTGNSCGPQDLDKGTTYLIYASTYSNQHPRIVKYRDIASVTEADKTQITQYDCKPE